MKITVIGTGVMGSGIAQCLATHGFEVCCHDINPAQLERAAKMIENGRYGLARAVERQKLTAEQADGTRQRLSYSAKLDEAVNDASIVLEVVPEQFDIKIDTLRKVEELTPRATILATNTSGMSVEALAASTGRAERVIGWHWASPPPVMKMAEIVVTRHTAADVTEAIVSAARRCGKNPVVVKDNPFAWGFAANRVINAMLREARLVVSEGLVDERGLDQLLVDGWGWPVGPFAMVAGAASGWGDGWESSITQIGKTPADDKASTASPTSAET